MKALGALQELRRSMGSRGFGAKRQRATVGVGGGQRRLNT